MKDNSEKYSVTYEEGRITLRAFSYRAEKGSMLHSGIFSRELASSFVAAVIAGTFLILFALTSNLRLFHYIIAIVVFIIVFPLSRIFIFKEPYLETVIDGNYITIALKRPLLGKSIRRKKNELKDLRIDYVRFEPENPDAIAFVEKIALQHGTVIPGFGEVKEFYNIVMDFGDETFTILTTQDKSEAEGIMVKLKNYLS